MSRTFETERSSWTRASQAQNSTSAPTASTTPCASVRQSMISFEPIEPDVSTTIATRGTGVRRRGRTGRPTP
jgi:hypothetical protein